MKKKEAPKVEAPAKLHPFLEHLENEKKPQFDPYLPTPKHIPTTEEWLRAITKRLEKEAGDLFDLRISVNGPMDWTEPITAELWSVIGQLRGVIAKFQGNPVAASPDELPKV